jgi:hypothetical protein
MKEHFIITLSMRCWRQSNQDGSGGSNVWRTLRGAQLAFYVVDSYDDDLGVSLYTYEVNYCLGLAIVFSSILGLCIAL